MIGYLIKSSLCLIVLLIVYRTFLEQEKMHRFNRYFLVFGLMFSLAIPLLIIELPAPAISNAQLSQQIDRLTTAQSYEPLPVPGPADNQPASQQQTGVPVIPYLFMGYLLVSGVLLIRLLQNLYSLATKVYRNERVPFQKAVLVLVPDGKVPHSFFNYIFVNKQMYQAGTIDEAIFTHELTHVRQKHSLDILFIELLKVAFWFNPSIYLYKKAMQLNHEFLADETVVSNTQNVSAYQRLLLKIQTNEKEIQLTSSIQYSITKKRIMMMTKKSTTLQTVWKQLAIIPLLAALIFTFSTRTAASQDVSTMSLQELMEVVSKKMESADSLTPKEKQELSTLLSKIQDELHPQLSPPAPQIPEEINDQNLLNILVNEQGLILMDEEPVPLDRVKTKVKKFITNNGADPELSESPQKAIIAIKKSKSLSENLFIDFFQEVEAAYLDLRNITAQAEYGVDYQQLIENSPRQTKIQEMYPIRISVAEPGQKGDDTQLPPPPAPPFESENPEATMQRMVESYNKHGKFYSDIAPVEGNRDKLEASYEKVMILYNEVDKLQKEIAPKNPPPPPPKPLSPNERIDRNSEKPQPPVKIDTTKINQLKNEYRESINSYIDIAPTKKNKPELQAAHTNVILAQKKYLEARNEFFKKNTNVKLAPPFPTPAGPTERIKNYERNQEKPAKNDTTKLEDNEEEYGNLLNSYVRIEATQENLDELKTIHSRIVELNNAIQKAYEEENKGNNDKKRLSFVPMTPDDRMMVYYRQHPELAKENRSILQMAANRFKKGVKKYMDMTPVQEDAQTLGIIYAQLRTFHNNWSPILKASGTGIELPPLPEAAWKRIKAYAN